MPYRRPVLDAPTPAKGGTPGSPIYPDRPRRDRAAEVRAALPHWNPDNLRAALLYPVEGGWNADILLRDAPKGQPIVLDRGEGQPFATRRAAETFLADFVTALTATWAPEQVLPRGAAARPDPWCGAVAHPPLALPPHRALAW